MLNKARRNNTLYVKLLGSEAGAVVNGELLSSLPPSVLAVLEADRNGGSFNPLRSATLGEWELRDRAGGQRHRARFRSPFRRTDGAAPPRRSTMPSRSRARGLAAAVVLALTLAPLHASTPKFFQAESQADFLKGEVENLSIDTNGRLVLGPATELVYETAAPFLWSMLAGADGSLFVGTGNEGKVYRIDADGNGSVFFDSAELEVHALAPAPNGGLYVATSPDGRIYKVDRERRRHDVLRSG